MSFGIGPQLLLVALLVLPCACDRMQAAQGNSPKDLTVFAAASLSESFSEAARAFERQEPGARISLNFAGSQQLRAQLEHGAPADVFAVASRKEMDAAVAAGVVAVDTVRTFARNRLVVIHPKANPGRITSLADLARPGVKLVVADPAVPVGAYTGQMLDRMRKDPAFGSGYKTGFTANVVSREENVKSVVAKVLLGEADAGVVYASDAGGEAAGELGTVAVPERFNPTADYPAGVVARSRQAELARRFVEFVASPAGQHIMQRHGFLPAGGTGTGSGGAGTGEDVGTGPGATGGAKGQ